MNWNQMFNPWFREIKGFYIFPQENLVKQKQTLNKGGR